MFCIMFAVCEFGRYGMNCGEVCNCNEGIACHPHNGSCEDGMCMIGYTGINCSSGLTFHQIRYKTNEKAKYENSI